MSRLLVLYGTTDGQTAKIAQAVAATWRARGADVDVVQAGKEGKDPRPQDYDGIVVAASVHVGGYQRAVRSWVRRHAAALTEKPTAFLSVCLGVLQPDAGVRADLDRIMDRFVGETGWTPTMTKSVAGALRYSRYGWLKRWVMRRIVRKAGMETDTRRDYEFTDWAELEVFAKGFFWTAKLCGQHRLARPTQAA
jgi:menaquinone-dependent protoporphyrinogen oxidase